MYVNFINYQKNREREREKKKSNNKIIDKIDQGKRIPTQVFFGKSVFLFN